MADKNRLASMIVGSMKSKAPESEVEEIPDEEEGEGESDLDTAAQEVLDAIHGGDVSGLAEALKAFVGMC